LFSTAEVQSIIRGRTNVGYCWAGTKRRMATKWQTITSGNTLIKWRDASFKLLKKSRR
jgi:hypothetical protein